MRSRRQLKILPVVIIFSVVLIFTESWSIQLLAQGIAEHFSKSDRKDLDNATKEEAKATELVNEANSIYSSIYNSTEDKSELSSKSKHLEKQALKKQLKAEELYESANATCYKIYKYHIIQQKEESKLSPTQLNKVRLLEELADQSYNRGQVLRQDEKKLKDAKQKYSKLTNANTYEKEAIQQQLVILKIFNGDQLPRIVSSNSSPTLLSEDESDSQSQEILGHPAPEQKIVIDSMRVKAIQDKLHYLSATNAFNIDSLSGFDKQSLSRAWYNYLYSDIAGFNIKEQKDTLPTGADSSQPQEKSETNALSDKATVSIDSTNKIRDIHQPAQGQKTEVVPAQAISSLDKMKKQSESDFLKYSDKTTTTYSVQIAADRAPLSQKTLRKIYSGNKNITMIQKDGWNKYSIGPFATFEEAQKFKNNCGVKSAFITSYLSGDDEQKTQPEPDTKIIKDIQRATLQKNNEIIFQVQIAASRIPLSDEKLHHIYKGNLPISMLREDGWYKYSVGKTENYIEARNTQQQTDVKGAFITACQAGNKLELYDAIRKTRAGISTTSGEVGYYIQIAAGKKPINKNTLQKIYSGKKEIRMSREDGWFKYRIFAGATYKQAASLKEQLSVEGAFVVALENGNKIFLQHAISLTK